MDLSKLSTADLEALRDGDLSRVSTEGLEYMQSAARPATPAKEPSMLDEFGRQIGLTARYGLEGAGQALDIGAAPIAYMLNKADKALTGSQRFKTASSALTGLANDLGLPRPQNATERIVGEGAKLLASGGGTLGMSQAAAKAPGVVGKAGTFLAQQPAAQLSAATGGGVASQIAKETDQNPYWQAAAAYGGTVLGGLLPGAASSMTGKVASLLPSNQRQVDIRISNILAEGGVDYAKLPTPLKETLRAEVGKALNTNGQLNPDAVRRLADIRRVGATPTLGMLTLDPVQVTREQNVAKMAANMGDEGLHSLPRMQNTNNQALIQFAERKAGGDADLFTAGQRTIGTILAKDEAARATENQLYRAAKDSAGRNVQLSRADFVNQAFDNLARENKGAFLPAEVESMLNQISVGQVTKGGRTFDVPFDVDTIDTLKTILAQESRSAKNGNVKGAIKAVRDALENVKLESAQSSGPGLVNSATAAAMQQADSLPAEALNAFNKARAFARARRTWQESSKGVNAAIDDAQPDKFIEQFFLRGTVADADGIARELRRNESALNVTKQAIINHLKEKALSGNDGEVGKFGQKAYNSALKAIGDRKLSLIFSPNEVEDLKALGRAASYMQFQPAGSAVNNSNSGALVMGRAGDVLDGFLRATPLTSSVADFTKGMRIKATTRQMKDVPRGLLMEPAAPADPYVRGLLPMSVYAGGLLGPQIGD